MGKVQYSTKEMKLNNWRNAIFGHNNVYSTVTSGTGQTPKAVESKGESIGADIHKHIANLTLQINVTAPLLQ